MVELKDATLTLGGRTLFRRLSMMALDGQMTCVTGAAGSGKTALLQVMLGFVLPDEGLVSIDGELLTPLSAPAFRRLMAYLPQRQAVTITQPTVDTTGLETTWTPYNVGRYQLRAIEEPLGVAPMGQKPIVIADDPAPELTETLRSLANAGHTVIVATTREDYLKLSDKTIKLGTHDTLIS